MATMLEFSTRPQGVSAGGFWVECWKGEVLGWQITLHTPGDRLAMRPHGRKDPYPSLNVGPGGIPGGPASGNRKGQDCACP